MTLWDDNDAAIEFILKFIQKLTYPITAIVGGLDQVILPGGRYARYNAAWILDSHYGKRVIHKRLLPCYDVFDETRYFKSAIDDPYVPIPIIVGDKKVNCDVLICEDIWNHQFLESADGLKPYSYGIDPVAHLQGTGPLFVINASPFWIGKIAETGSLLRSIRDKLKRTVVWCNQVGAHDDIITGGYSMIACVDSVHALYMADLFVENSMIASIDPCNEGELLTRYLKTRSKKCVIADEDLDMWSIYKALCLHMSDYKRRCGFKRAVLGLSGGIDSAVVAVIAADVFGSENVTALTMPSSIFV